MPAAAAQPCGAAAEPRQSALLISPLNSWHRPTFQGMTAVNPGRTGLTPLAWKLSPAAVSVALVRL